MKIDLELSSDSASPPHILLLKEEGRLGVEPRTDKNALLKVLRKPWLADFKAGRVKLSQYNAIL